MPGRVPDPSRRHARCGDAGGEGDLGNPARDVVITAGHIVNNPNALVYQPRRTVGQGQVQIIGTVTERSPFRVYSSVADFIGTPGDDSPQSRINSNYDFACIDVGFNERATSCRIAEIYNNDAQALPIRDPRNGETVRWLGYATGVAQTGRVRNVSFWLARQLDPGVPNGTCESIHPTTLIEVEGDVQPRVGDSGAAIVAVDDMHIVGIHIAGKRSNRGRNFAWASRVPASPEALRNGIGRVGWGELVTWLQETQAWLAENPDL
ncbi:trypsin-like peptidase domain-containing protein [Streptomyces sp. NC-S4]